MYHSLLPRVNAAVTQRYVHLQGSEAGSKFPCLYRSSILNCGDSMTEERKHAILLAATILAARKLNDSESKPWAVHVAITDANRQSENPSRMIDARWPAEE